MFPLRLSQLRSILVRNLDTSTATQPSCSVVDCYCDLRSIASPSILIHQSQLCKQTLNPRWVLPGPKEEERRLKLATIQHFNLNIIHSNSTITTPTILLTTAINVLELVPLNVTYKALQHHANLPINTILFEASGGGLYALPEVVYTLTGKISISRVPAMKELREDILASSFATTVLVKAYAYQRSTDERKLSAEHAREDIVVMARRQANDPIVKEELELILRSIKVKAQEEQLKHEENQLKRWENKIDRYEALVYDRAQHVSKIASKLNKLNQHTNQQTNQQTNQTNQSETKNQSTTNASATATISSTSSTASTASIASTAFATASLASSTTDVRNAQILHLETNLHRLHFVLHSRQLKLMYELTTIYPIERIQLEASGHATALRHQRGSTGKGGRHHTRGGAGGTSTPEVMQRRTSAFEDDLNETMEATSSTQSFNKNNTNLNKLLPHRLPPEIMQSKGLSKSKKRGDANGSNQVMSIRGLVLPMWENIMSSEEEKVSEQFKTQNFVQKNITMIL
jgi:hypothetical protein